MIAMRRLDHAAGGVCALVPLVSGVPSGRPRSKTRVPRPKAEHGGFASGSGAIVPPPTPRRSPSKGCSENSKAGVFSFHSAAGTPASEALPRGKSRGEKSRRLSFKAFSWRWDDDEPLVVGSGASFDQGVALFNEGEYYKCHDVLEEAWNQAQEPQRSIIHGMLQCSVGMYHLLNQNHKGAMIELGEGLNKLKRVCNRDGPMEEFHRSMSLLLEFIYQTQMEFAACAEDMCITLDGSEQSYSLLGNYGAGQALYTLQRDEQNKLFLVFSHAKFATQNGNQDYGKIEVPLLQASEEDFLQYQ